MICFGEVWCGVVSCGVVWGGVVWCGVVVSGRGTGDKHWYEKVAWVSGGGNCSW